MTDYKRAFLQEMLKEYMLFRMKNADYDNAFAEHGVPFILARIREKLRRYLNISRTQIILVKEEGLEKELRDLAVYCKLAILLLREKEP